MVAHPADFPTPPNIRNSYEVRLNLAFDRRNRYATTPLSRSAAHTRCGEKPCWSQDYRIDSLSVNAENKYDSL